MAAILTLALAVLALVGISAFFNAAETALFALPPLTRHRLRSAERSTARHLARLLERPSELLGTVLIGGTVAAIAASSLCTLLGLAVADRAGLPRAATLAAAAVLMTLLLLAASEVAPKIIAVRRAEEIAHRTAPVIDALRWLLGPVNRLLAGLAARVTRPAPAVPFPTRDELQTMVEIGRETGVLGRDEEAIIWNLVELARRTVGEVMTPRREIVALETRATVESARELVRRTGKSRLPVYEGRLDATQGVLYAKDLIGQDDARRPVGTLARPVPFVPESKALAALLEDFRRQGIHIAVVVDEFGQTAGVVTLEDILEGIFGEIVDEHDRPTALPYERVDDRTWLVRGDIDLRTLNRVFRRAFRNVHHARLAGLIQSQFGHVPRAGETLRFRGLDLEVTETAGPRIIQVRIRRREPSRSPKSP